MSVCGIGSITMSIVQNYRSTVNQEIKSFSNDLREVMSKKESSEIQPMTREAVKDQEDYKKATSFEKEQMRSHIASVKHQMYRDVNEIISRVELNLIDNEQVPDKVESICTQANIDLDNYFRQKRTNLQNGLHSHLNGYSRQLVDETISMVYEG